MTSRWDRAFLRSKFGRRLFTLFVACALLPIVVLFLLSYRSVALEFEAQAGRRLQELVKSTEMGILARLNLLDVELQLAESAMPIGADTREGRLDEMRFKSIVLEAPPGRVEIIAGPGLRPPELTPEERAHLVSGRPLLQIRPASEGGFGYLLARQEADSLDQRPRVIWGEIESDYLWWGTPMDSTLPADAELIVLSSESPAPLLSTIDLTPSFHEALAKELAMRSIGDLQWQDSEGNRHRAVYRLANTRPVYGLAPLVVIAGEATDVSLLPFLTFKRNLVAIVLLSLWIILLLTIGQIRRHLDPLEKLRTGTQQISEGNLETRVHVDTDDEIAELADSFNAMAGKLETHFRTLTTTNELAQAVLSSLNTNSIIDTVLAQFHRLLDCDRVVVTLMEQEGQSVGHLFHRDAGDSETLGPVVRRLDERDLAMLHRGKGQLLTPAGSSVPSYFISEVATTGLSIVAFPIVLRGELVAIVAGDLRRPPDAGGQPDMNSLRQVADQVAVALANAKLVEDLDALSWGTLAALGRTIDVRSHWTMGHSERVTDLAQKVGKRMGLTERRLHSLLRGSLLHDIGKIGVPTEILDKDGSLTDEEMNRVRDHVRIGVQILRPVPALRDVLPVVAQHHEWFDGKGYPAGLAGAEICLEARILSVADCYDALRSHRPYRAALSHEAVLAYLAEQSGTQFDPEVVGILVSVVNEERSHPLQEELSTSVAI